MTDARAPYAWFVRNARSGLFLVIGGNSATRNGHETFKLGPHRMRWVSDRKEATGFASWEAGRAFLRELDRVGPVPPGWHLIDYRESELVDIAAGRGPVRTQKQVIDEALAADRVREAIRRAHWTIKPAVAVLGLFALAFEQMVGR